MLLNAILVALACVIGKWEWGLGVPNVERPLVVGTLVGIFLGNIPMGVVVGFELEMIFIGSFSIGAAIPPDYTVASAICTGFAIVSGVDAEAAVVLAMPVSILASFLSQLEMGFINPAINSLFYRLAEKGNRKGMEILHVLGTYIVRGLLYGIPTAMAFYLGADAISAVVAMIPENVSYALDVVCGLIGALGLALLMRMMVTKKNVIYLFLGFILVVYFGVSTLPVCMLAVILAIIITQVQSNKPETTTTVQGGNDNEF